jgi:hypothetical protein
MLSQATGLRHAGTRLLCTSLSFLNRKNITGKAPRKLLLFGNGNERFVAAITFFLRKIDANLGWRSSVYGWAFYFGKTIDPDLTVWSNVCVRCGSAHPSPLLITAGRTRSRAWLPSLYTCPKCGAENYFTEDSCPSG